MEDPVKTEDGQTYDRPSIEKWLDGKLVSPLTNLPLKTRELVPNVALKNKIEKWKERKEKSKKSTKARHNKKKDKKSSKRKQDST